MDHKNPHQSHRVGEWDVSGSKEIYWVFDHLELWAKPSCNMLPSRTGYTLQLDHLTADLQWVQGKPKKWSETTKNVRIFLMSYRKPSLTHVWRQQSCLPELQDQSSLTNPTSGMTVRPCLGKGNLIVKAAEIFLWTHCISTILHLCISAFGLLVSISFFFNKWKQQLPHIPLASSLLRANIWNKSV